MKLRHYQLIGDSLRAIRPKQLPDPFKPYGEETYIKTSTTWRACVDAVATALETINPRGWNEGASRARFDRAKWLAYVLRE